jgi:hypothetical protein
MARKHLAIQVQFKPLLRQFLEHIPWIYMVLKGERLLNLQVD